MTDFTKQVINIIKSIPPGYVMTYGQIAEVAGSPRGARQVSRVLHSMTRKYGLPWHRVIGSSGKISLDEKAGGNEQRLLLEAEGVVFGLNGQIDLTKYRYYAEPDLDL